MPGVKCPHCGVHTVNEPAVKQLVVTTADEPIPRPIDANVWFMVNEISVVTCRACNEDFLTKGEQAIWPLSITRAPEGVPEKVGEAYEDARLCYASGGNIGALLAARTALERLEHDKGVSSYKELSEKQIITPALYGAADQLRLWANVAAHDDIDTGTFDAQEVGDILDYLRLVLESVYTHQARVDKFVSRTKELEAQGLCSCISPSTRQMELANNPSAVRRGVTEIGEWRRVRPYTHNV